MKSTCKIWRWITDALNTTGIMNLPMYQDISAPNLVASTKIRHGHRQCFHQKDEPNTLPNQHKNVLERPKSIIYNTYFTPEKSPTEKSKEKSTCMSLYEGA